MSFFNEFNREPSFTVSNDRVLDHLRVRQANTLKLPPNTQIDPNSPGGTGDYNPATNPTLRSHVSQAGAIVYNTTPVAADNTGSSILVTSPTSQKLKYKFLSNIISSKLPHNKQSQTHCG